MGNQTILGGSTSPAPVREAMDEADLHFVEMRELLEKSGDFIADVLGTESAYVTSGCAAAITLSVAGCMAGTDPDKIGRLPDTTGMKNEVIIQKRQRYSFDRCFTLSGGKLVVVGDEDGCSADQLESAIGPNTAAVAYIINAAEPDDSVVTIEDAMKIAHDKGVPVIADAASQIYPLDFFRESAQIPDLACFGAKYFGAPHSTGIVAGKKDMVDAVAAQGFIAYHYDGYNAFGRAMKLDRQEIVGVVSALDAWFSMNHEDRLLEYDRRMSTIQEGLQGLESVQPRVVDNRRFWATTLHVDFDPAKVGKNAQQVADELDAGNPRIWVGVQGEGTLTMNVHTLNEDEEATIADRLRELLSG
jgi:L-seryl-tRNA(Ser) seleniumtransferase